MEYKIIESGNRRILECLPDGGVISTESDALDVVGLCGGEETDSILLYHSNLQSDFYNLKSGLAGKVLLKFSIYQLKAAAVIPPEIIGDGRFYEMVIETNRRNDFRVFSSREEALNWYGRL
jgi:PadR family transcriptional regulator AphA